MGDEIIYIVILLVYLAGMLVTVSYTHLTLPTT